MAFSNKLKRQLNVALCGDEYTAELEAFIGAEISDTAYNSTSWDGETTVGASKNALRDKFVTVDAAIAANIAQTITNGVTTSAPSQDAVYDALALKLTASQAANEAALGGTLTGSVTGSMADVAASACAGDTTPSAAQVDTCVASLATAVNLQLKELQTKLNDEIAALKSANIQASA